MDEPDAYEDIERRVAELRRLKARKPESLRRQFYLTAGLINAIADMDLSDVQEAAEWLADFFEEHTTFDIISAVFDCEELTEDEWSSYHPASERTGPRPLSHDPVRGGADGHRTGDATTDAIQTRTF